MTESITSATTEETDEANRTRRQGALLTAGYHPLTLALHRPLRLHPEAAPHDDKQAPGRRCGNCAHRMRIAHRDGRFLKCGRGDGDRISSEARTDLRGWWPGCLDHERRTDD